MALHRRRVLGLTLGALFCAALGVVVAPVWSASRPVVKIVKAPPASTTSTEAEFRFKTGAKRTWCRRDKQRYRRCRFGMKYTGVRPGRHSFIVRARHQGRTTFVRRNWTVRRTKRRPWRPQPALAAVSRTTDPETGAVVAGARLIFGDEFDGTTLDTQKWGLYDSPGHDGNGLRRPSAFSLDGLGNLVVTAKMVNGELVSGGMAGLLDFTYGRVEFRVKTEPDPTGTMSGVVLTWPQKQSAPEFTENDMYETGPRVNNRSAFDTFIHFGETTFWQKWTTHEVDPSQWHTIAMEWYPNLLEIYVDGLLGFSVSDPAVIPDILHHLAIQLDARADRTLVKPIRMFVDYVRVYQ